MSNLTAKFRELMPEKGETFRQKQVEAKLREIFQDELDEVALSIGLDPIDLMYFMAVESEYREVLKGLASAETWIKKNGGKWEQAPEKIRERYQEYNEYKEHYEREMYEIGQKARCDAF